MRALKQLYRSAISTFDVPKLLGNSDDGVIFMLHRFPDPDMANEASHEIEAIRAMLGYLRRRKFELVPLTTLFDRAATGEPLNGAVAFTIDDGYLDHATIGARLFAEYDCPATTFLTSGFLDGALWFWWDKIEFVFRHARRRSFDVIIGPNAPAMAFSWNTDTERAKWLDAVIETCKRIPDAVKHEAIARLAAAAEVDLPAKVPSEYAPMAWADARRCEQSGMTFGPHTVTHPILAQTPDAQSAFEIEESWRRLSSEVSRPVPVFCYPNGQVDDFGDRETKTIGRIGLRGAVVGSPGYATGEDIRGERSRFRVQRFGMPGNMDGLANMIQFVTGLERIKLRARGGRS
ncbi:MAG TPA: polysaccharide deacetylase family protein [Gemmatimonadaceae bacterium]